MKNIFILLFFVPVTKCRGQVDIINQSLTDSSMNFFYIGVDNRIRVSGLGDNYSLEISGGGGSLLKTARNQYVVRVAFLTDLCELTILKGTKNIFRKSYKVRFTAVPIATAGGLRDTTVKAAVLLLNPFISVLLPGCYFRWKIRTTSFHATFIHDTDSIFSNTFGPVFSEEQIKLIKQSVPGDKIFFDKIRALSHYSCRSQELEPFWIKIL